MHFSGEEETNLDEVLTSALDAGDGANVSFELGEMVNDDFDQFFRLVVNLFKKIFSTPF